MKAAYLKAKYQFELRDVELREPDRNEVEVAVKACGFCGHDNILANYAATEWEPFGHEFAGVITKIGADVRNVAVGDRVAIETSTFNPYSDAALNGRPDLCTDCTDYMKRKEGDTMGFAERTIVPANLVVNIRDLSFEEACILEPMGVAADLILTADIHLKAFVKGVRGYFSYYLRRFSLCFCLNNAFQSVLSSQTATMVKKHFDFIICFALLNHKNSIRFVFLRMVIWGG